MEPLTSRRRARGSGLLPGLLIGALAPGSDIPPPVDWTERIEVASDDAYEGPWRMNESRFRYVDDPTVTLDGAGAVGVAWADQLRKDVLFQAFSLDGRRRFAKPTNVSRSARVFSWHPRMVTAPDDPSQDPPSTSPGAVPATARGGSRTASGTTGAWTSRRSSANGPTLAGAQTILRPCERDLT